MSRAHVLIKQGISALLLMGSCISLAASAQSEKPNILVIWGDDIGWENVSAYGMGVMGYTTPSIDSIGMEGIRFTDRMDPFESYSDKESYGHLMQKVSWLMAPMGELMAAHLQTLKDYPRCRAARASTCRT
jgi:hypothetical protein|nr:hypothetical protein [Thiocapsa sp.]